MTSRQEMSRTEKEIKMKEASERAAKIREFREIVIARRSHIKLPVARTIPRTPENSSNLRQVPEYQSSAADKITPRIVAITR